MLAELRQARSDPDIISVNSGSTVNTPKATSITLKSSNIVLPFCATTYFFEIKAFSHDNLLIEKATYTMPSTAFTKMPLTSIPVVSTSTATAAFAQHTIEVGQTGILMAESIVQVNLAAAVIWKDGTSACSVPLLTPIPTCVYDVNTHSLTIAGAVPTDRPASVGTFKIILSNIINPKSTNTYSLTVVVKTKTGCEYAQGSYSVVIDKISQFESVVIKPSNFFLNTYVPYTVEVKPMSASIESGEYLLFSVPSGLGTTTAVECTPKSANLIQTTCSLVGLGQVKVQLNTDAAKYALNKNLIFSVAYISNPTAAGQFAGFQLSLLSSAGSVFETANLNALVLTYGDLINLQTVATVAFTSNLKGSSDTAKYTLNFNSHVPQNSKLIMRLSSKFKDMNFQLKESVPAMKLSSVDKTTGEITMEFSAPNKPETTISYTLEGKNPAAELIGSEDIQFELFSLARANSMFKISSPVDRIQFICDASCKDCSDLFSTCTSCLTDFVLTGTSCTPKPISPSQIPRIIRAAEKSVPFIFVGVSLALTVFMLFFGLVCKQRNYWGNCLYSLLRLNYVAALAVFCYLISINEDPKWLLYSMLALVGVHLLISLVLFVKLRSAVLSGGLGVQTSQNKYVNAFVNKNKHVVQDSRKEFGKFFFSMLWLSLLLNPNLMRWFFSAAKAAKGTFWEFDSETFQYIKVLLQRFHMLYIFLVSIGIIVTTSVSFAYNIYLFKFDMIGVCVVDLVVYVVAYFELNAFSAKPKKVEKDRTIDGYMQPQSAKGDKSELIDPSMILDEEEGANNGKDKLAKFGAKQPVQILPLLIEEEQYRLPSDRLQALQKQSGLDPKARDSQEKGLKGSGISIHNPDDSPNDETLKIEDLVHVRRTEAFIIEKQEDHNFIVNKPNAPQLPHRGSKTKDGGGPEGTEPNLVHVQLNDTEDLKKTNKPGRLFKPGRRRKRSCASMSSVRPKSRSTAPQFDTRAPFRVQPESRVKKSEVGVYQPQLIEPVAFRHDKEKSSPSIDQKLEDSTKNYSQIVPSDNEKDVIGFTSENKKLAELESNLVKPVPSTFGQNNKFDKWWFSSPFSYLEIIYEQNEGEEPLIYENPHYDDEEKKLRGRTGQPLVDWDDDGDRNEDSLPTVKPDKNRLGKNSKDSLLNDPESERLDDGTLGRFGLNDSSDSIKHPDAPGKARLARELKKLQNGSNEDYEADLNAPENEVEQDDQLDKEDQIELDKAGNILLINGQSLVDLSHGIVKDKNDVPLNVYRQKIADLDHGLLADSKGRKFHANLHSLGELRKGLMRSQSGELLRVKDQDFEELAKEGILRDRQGNVVEINGQKPRNLSNGILKIEDGAEDLKLADQTDKQLKKGVIVDPEENKIVLNQSQDPAEFRKGLLRDTQGRPHRLIDQSLEDLKKGLLQDSALRKSIEEKKKHSHYPNRRDPRKVKFDNSRENHFDPFTDSKGKIGSNNNGVDEDLPEDLQEEGSAAAARRRKNQKVVDPDLPDPIQDKQYYDKDGNPVRVQQVKPQTKLYDSLGNIVDPDSLRNKPEPEGDTEAGPVSPTKGKKGDSAYFNIDGEPIPLDQVEQEPTLFDRLGRPVRYNNLGFIHKFYNSDGDLVDYRDLSSESVMRDEKRRPIPVDPLNRKRLTVFEDGDLYLAKDEMGEPLSAKDLLVRQRFYDSKGNLLADNDLLKERGIYDKHGNLMGRVENRFAIKLPRLENKERMPIDARDAVKTYLFKTPANVPVTRDDFEKQVEVFDSKGNRIPPAVIEDLIEEPNAIKRVFDENGFETEMDLQVRNMRLKDSKNRVVDIGQFRKSGKIYNQDREPVPGKVLARISGLIEAIKKSDPDIEKSRSSLGLNRSQKSLNRSDLSNSPNKRINSTSTRKQLDPRGPSRGGPVSKHSTNMDALDELQMNLMAEESFDLEVNIEEVEESGDVEHELFYDDPAQNPQASHLAKPGGAKENNFLRSNLRKNTDKTDSVHFIDHTGGEVACDSPSLATAKSRLPRPCVSSAQASTSSRQSTAPLTQARLENAQHPADDADGEPGRHFAAAT